jgi:O-antigen/teichoic acid export membrane protein
MEKALKMGRTSAAGSLNLFVGKIVSTVIVAAGTIILGLLISESDYGLYAVALIPSSILILFQDWGVGVAMTRQCAHCRAVNDEGELRKIIVSGLTFQVATGLTLTLVSFLVAGFIGTTIFGKPESSYLMVFASFIVLGTSLLVPSQSVFVGFERMGLYSIVLTLQAIVQTVLAPLLVYLGYGAFGAIVGYTMAILVVGVSAVILLYFAVFRKLQSGNQSKTSLFQTLKPMLRYGIPLAVGTISAGILPQVVYSVMASYVDLASIGNYRIAINFAVLLTFFTFPITTVLFPAFSKIDPRNEGQLLKTVFTSSVKYTSLFLVPATMATMVLSKTIIGTIYGDKWLLAPPYLSLYIVGGLFVILGSFSVTSLLTGMGDTMKLMKLSFLNLAVGIPLALLLIPQIGIFGVIFAILVSGVPSTFVGLFWAWRLYGVKADFRSSGRIFFSSAIAAVFTYLFLSILNTSHVANLIVGLMLFLATYLIVVPIAGGISQTDVNNLRRMFSELGPAAKVLEIPLKLIEHLLRIKHHDSG